MHCRSYILSSTQKNTLELTRVWFSSKGVNFDVKSEKYVVRYNSGAIMGFKVAEPEESYQANTYICIYVQFKNESS